MSYDATMAAAHAPVVPSTPPGTVAPPSFVSTPPVLVRLWAAGAAAVVGFGPTAPRPRRGRVEPQPASISGARLHRHYHDALGLYRVFNAAEYRFYRTSGSPPGPDDVAFDSNATLPHTPSDTFGGNQVWYLAVQYFNGVLLSGFRQLGPHGEQYVRLDLNTDTPPIELSAPPKAPIWNLEVRPSGVIRIVAMHLQRGSLRPTHWEIAWSNDGSDPAADAPDITVAFSASGVEKLVYDLPAQLNGVVVKVRLQTRRTDGADVRYSEGSIKSATASTVGPTAPSSSVQ